MKLLIVVNNHNSLTVVDFCIGLRKHDSSLDIAVVCTGAIKRARGEFFDANGIRSVILEPNVATDALPQVLKEAANRNGNSEESVGSRSLFRLLRTVVSASTPYCLIREQIIVERLKRCKAKALELLDDVRPDVVLSISDRSHDYAESSTLWAAQQRGVPILIPYVAQYDVDAAITYRVGDDGKIKPEFCPFWPFSIYKLISFLRLRPQLYKGVFFQAAYVLNAHRRSGTLSAYPWWVGNGISDIVCVDSQHSQAKYVRYGVRKEKTVITGHVSYDRVYVSHVNRESVRARLISKYSLEPDKKILIVSVPQYAEQGYYTWGRHWQEIESIIRNVTQSNNNVLLSVHPRSNVEDYRFLERNYECRIVEEALADVIGAADLFLASNSSTFTWAALCGIGALALKSPVPFLFSFLETIRPVESDALLVGEIEHALAGHRQSFQKDWQLLSREDVFDGRFAERFLDVLHRARSARHAA